MLDSFVLIGLPYVALGVCIAATVARFRSSRYTVSALSSQFLESRSLRWGSTAWHVGILLVLAALLAQIALGFAVAANHRWGAAWAGGTLVPYLWSLVTLRPDASFVADMPPLVKAHMASAWVLLLLVPFSRLVHVFSVPASYLLRAPQLVVWSNLGRARGAPGRAGALRTAEAPTLPER